MYKTTSAKTRETVSIVLKSRINYCWKNNKLLGASSSLVTDKLTLTDPCMRPVYDLLSTVYIQPAIYCLVSTNSTNANSHSEKLNGLSEHPTNWLTITNTKSHPERFTNTLLTGGLSPTPSLIQRGSPPPPSLKVTR